MPVARFEMPDGRVARFEVPEGTTPEQAHAMMAQSIGQMQPATSKPQAAPLSTGDRVMQGLRDPFDGGAQLLTKMLPDSMVQAGNKANNWLADKTGLVGRLPEGGVDEQMRGNEAQYKAGLAASGHTGIDWARLGGNVVSPANLAIAAKLPAGASLAGKIGSGALGGGLSSLMAPVTEGTDFLKEKLMQVGVGTGLGGLVPAAGTALRKVINPNAASNANLALLQSEGVRPTIGQTLGGFANKVEERATSLPFVGDAISSARRGAAEDLNRAVANRALAPIGAKLPSGLQGREAVAHVNSALSDAYENLLPSLTVKADAPFNVQIANLKGMVKNGALDPKAAKAFDRLLDGDLLGKFKGQQALTGQTLKQVEGDIGQHISRLGASTDADQRLIGDAFKEVQSALRDLTARSNPQAAKELTAINTGWANFKRMQKASSALGAEDGIFSPAQLLNAVKAADRSKDKGSFARGGALMQDLADAGRGVLGDRVPDSGTAGRMMNMAALGSGFVNPAIPLGLLGGSAMYSRPAQSLLRGAVTNRPAAAKQIGGLLEQASPMLAPAGGLLGLQYMNQ